MGFFSKITSALGFGSKGSGGTRDAFRQFSKFAQDIDQFVDARQNELTRQGDNGFLGEFRRPFESAIQTNNAIGAQIAGLQGRADGIGGLLRSSALSSTQGARSDALRAARVASGGRGGGGFGGGAGAIAARAAQGAASQQNAALSGALLQGEQFKLGFEQQNIGLLQQNAQLGGQLAQGLTGAIGGQAALEETARARGDTLQNLAIQGRVTLGSAALGQGLQGQSNLSGRRSQFSSGLLGGLFSGFGAGG